MSNKGGGQRESRRFVCDKDGSKRGWDDVLGVEDCIKKMKTVRPMFRSRHLVERTTKRQ